jgi:hypothetical protein
MRQSPTLQAINLRIADIEKTVAVTTEAIIKSGLPEDSPKIISARAKLAELKEEWKTLKIKAEKLEEAGAIPKRSPGRPKKDLGDNLLLPCDNDNRLSYIQNLRLSIEKDEQAIEIAEEKLAIFKAEKLDKIAEKEKLIRLTEKKLEDSKGISLEDL